MTLETANNFIDIAFIGLCFFCSNLLLLRRRDPGVYVPLALLFLFQGISTLVFMFVEISGHKDQISTLIRISVPFFTLDITCPFLFWLYVRGLTSEGEIERIPKLRYHLIPIIVTSLLMSSLAFLPVELNDGDLPEDHPAMARALLTVLAVVVGDILFNIIIGTYLYLTIRRLRSYNKRLREVFASTENRELNWVWAITFTGGIFWLVNIALSATIWTEGLGLTENNNVMGLLANIALFLLFWVIGIWGLRQRPGLTRGPVTEPEKPEIPSTQKYEKSALDNDRAARIAKKIEAAMQNDMLYRDPNLSLWDLAKHIGVTSHYVSQTLNTVLGSSFFDYINRWRIEDAVKQLNTTDETILMIAYDVGFNSRSAFYKAFKRETGKTPSDMRK